MFIKRYTNDKNSKPHAYWQLVEYCQNRSLYVLHYFSQSNGHQIDWLEKISRIYSIKGQ